MKRSILHVYPSPPDGDEELARRIEARLNAPQPRTPPPGDEDLAWSLEEQIVPEPASATGPSEAEPSVGAQLAEYRKTHRRYHTKRSEPREDPVAQDEQSDHHSQIRSTSQSRGTSRLTESFKDRVSGIGITRNFYLSVLAERENWHAKMPPPCPTEIQQYALNPKRDPMEFGKYRNMAANDQATEDWRRLTRRLEQLHRDGRGTDREGIQDLLDETLAQARVPDSFVWMTMDQEWWSYPELRPKVSEKRVMLVLQCACHLARFPAWPMTSRTALFLWGMFVTIALRREIKRCDTPP
ncbi:hypothetical protein HKX48_009543 [Thoreauomyces humboldtii]|nr:hypothetical protein HKX48_009543 [Thoreauomyces humboldtii]